MGQIKTLRTLLPAEDKRIMQFSEVGLGKEMRRNTSLAYIEYQRKKTKV
jgi:hypothetical protein